MVAQSPLVKFVAGRTGARPPLHVDQADLISYGMIGLVEAMERSDPHPGAPLRDLRHAAGSRRDHRRAPLARLGAASVRSRARDIEQADSKLEHELGRAPTDAELSERLGHRRGGAPGGAAADLELVDPRPGGALDDPGRLGRHASPCSTRSRTRTPPIPAGRPRHQRGQGPALRRRSRTCPSARRSWSRSTTSSNLTLREIGEVLGVTESRVSQLHSKAVLRLRSKLKASG